MTRLLLIVVALTLWPSAATATAPDEVKTIRLFVASDEPRARRLGDDVRADTEWLIGEVNALFEDGPFRPRLRISLAEQVDWSDGEPFAVPLDARGAANIRALKDRFTGYAKTTRTSHDMAILLTARPLSGGSWGRGSVQSLCKPGESVAVVRVLGDAGDPHAVARYIGYALGIDRDGRGNGCSPRGSLMEETPNRLAPRSEWSVCSRDYVSAFFDKQYRRRAVACLDDHWQAAPRTPKPRSRATEGASKATTTATTSTPPPGPSTRTIEVWVVNDHERFLHYGEHTEPHASWLLGEVNAIFERGGFSPTIRVAEAGQATWRAADPFPVTEGAAPDPATLHRRFADWTTASGPVHDVAILLTGHKLARGVSGYGGVGSACWRGHGATVIHVDGSVQDPLLVARFLAKAVGVSQDEPGSRCGHVRGVMHSVLPKDPGEAEWSDCNRAAWREFLSGTYPMRQTACLDDAAMPAPRLTRPNVKHDVAKLGIAVRDPFPLAEGWHRRTDGPVHAAVIRERDLVWLEGVVRGRPTLKGLIGRLPPTARPHGRLVFNVARANNTARIEITPDGGVRWIAGDSKEPWISLDGIQFAVKGGTSLSLNEAWLPQEGFTPPRAHRSEGHVVLTGVLARSEEAGDVMARLPDPALHPKKERHYVTRDELGPARVAVHPDGLIRWVEGDPEAAWVSLSGISYVTGKDHGLRGAAGEVTRRGAAVQLAGRGSVSFSGLIARLPDADRPRGTHIFSLPSDAGPATVSVPGDGRMRAMKSLSMPREVVLDGIRYRVR